MVHSSLSALGSVEGGAEAVVRGVLGVAGTVVVPAFTPQASVAAVGARAAEVTSRQPLGYAVGRGSPFEWLSRAGARIVLLGVGHDRNSFLHYAESLVPHHRRKVRRFPYLVDGERVWVRTDDVGDDNGRFFPQVGAEFGETGGVRRGKIGDADCQVMDCVPFVGFARRRLAELLR
ncbi:aminoglycoside N(3)-acetyltransferase [Amycolatopsis sp. AA4]|uniref:AAC(3) family N-acetyltransferase n=1 Tax=Actinomycetes TaxID=1760 RepID=UPI000996A2EC|nr:MULTISPECIES: AAC(3) family N-acetyltransferase [Actinomycetes]ATY16183.1 aminoglycoside N(3)-acetyltransferase [Amycolatopsis sp. AA4]